MITPDMSDGDVLRLVAGALRADASAEVRANVALELVEEWELAQ